MEENELMIVDFTSIKGKLNQVINLFLRAEIERRTPLLSMAGRRIAHEGDKTSYETTDKEERQMEYQMAETSFSLTRDEMAKMTFPEILKRIEDAAEDMAKQIEGGVFQTISKEVDKVGNTIEEHSQFSPETLLKGLEIIDIDFDDARDKPRMPTLFVHPNVWGKLKEQDARMTEEERREFERRQKEILDRKYAQYVERESKRKLVD